MRFTAAPLLISAIALGAFAWWGQYTVAGRARYDEMDGLYPFGARLLAGCLVLVAFGLLWFASRQRRRRLSR